MDSTSHVCQAVTAFVADLTGLSLHDLPSAEESGPDWLAVLRQWLARQSCGLVSIAHPETFEWPGH